MREISEKPNNHAIPIYSASRKEDMPAFHIKELLEKYKTTGSDSFWVLWTKNPLKLVGAPFDWNRVAIQLTVTGLAGSPLEPQVPSPALVWDAIEKIIASGANPALICWRLDPIIPKNQTPAMVKTLAQRASSLGITRCVTSFVTWYDRVKSRWPEGAATQIEPARQRKIAETIRDILAEFDITLHGCAQPHLRGVVEPARCIDGDYYAHITGLPLVKGGKDPFQRKSCSCTPSIDVGRYRPCPADCQYCYAETVSDEENDSCQPSLFR